MNEETLLAMLRDTQNIDARNEALTFVYNQMRPKVKKWINKDFRGKEDFVKDVFHDSIVVFLKQVSNFKGESKLATYWMSIFRRLLWRALEKEGKLKHSDYENWEIFKDPELNEQDFLIQEDTIKGNKYCLEKAMAELKEDAQTLIRLKYIDDIDWETIAKHFSISNDAARKRGSDIIKKLGMAINQCIENIFN